MGDLFWILSGLGLGAAMLIGLYLFQRWRRGEPLLPISGGRPREPLDVIAPPPAHHDDPLIGSIGAWSPEGVGPVRRVSPEYVAEAPPLPGKPRAPKFIHEHALRDLQDGTGEPSLGEVASMWQSEPEPAPPARDEPAAVVPLYLVARDPRGFSGERLIEAFARHGFEYGEMDLYHHVDPRGHVLFSLMNGVDPGTFDPSSLPELHTPALALFLRLPVHGQPGLVFEQFLDIAHRLAENLDGVLLDEHREELSSESIDRMRETALD